MPRPRMTLARQYLLLQMLIVVVVLIAVAAISMAQTARTTEVIESRRALGSAESLAKQSIVQTRVDVSPPGGDASLAATAETTRQVAGASFVAVARLDGTVLVSSNPALVGQRLPVPSKSPYAGRAWTGLTEIDGDALVTAVVPVQDRTTGEVLGVAAIGRSYPSALERLGQAIPNLLTYLGVATALGLVGSLLLARRVKRQTLGMEPTEIAALVEHREALLHGVKEGVIALDPQERVTVINDSASTLLGLPPSAQGRPLRELDLDQHVLTILTTDSPGPDRLALVGDRVVSFNRMPMMSRGKEIGTVTTMRDRTELSSLEEELGITKATTNTLRAQTHEFANQLHVITGLLRQGQLRDAERFIDGVRINKNRMNDQVTSRILDPTVAALLIAKVSLAAERGVTMEIAPDSRLAPLRDHASHDITTVVGNLIDNALDAVGDAARKVVTVRILQSPEAVTVTVHDSGPGVPTDEIEDVFRQGYSTKAPISGGRGFGLALTRLVCRRSGGEVTVHNEDGAVFTATVHMVSTSSTTDGGGSTTDGGRSTSEEEVVS